MLSQHYKNWLSIEDARRCKRCEEMHGQIYEINEIPHPEPPLHEKCRCYIAVMKAIYDSGIPISFKGSMVLRACLIEAGYIEDTRHTVDIDANWYSDVPPTAEQMTDSLQKAFERSGMDLTVSLYRMYGEGRSAGFEIADRGTDEILFTMDIDVNRPAAVTKIYEISGIRFRGASIDQMLADKMPSEMKNWSSEGWGAGNTDQLRIAGPIEFLRYSGTLDGQSIRIEIWPIPGADGTKTIVEFSRECENVEEAAGLRDGFIAILDEMGILLHEDALKTELILNQPDK